MSVNTDQPAGQLSPVVNAFQTLKDRWWLAVAGMVLGAAISLAVAVTSTKQYTGGSSLLIRQSNLETLIDPNAAANSEDPARLTATNLLLVTSTAVAERVQAALGTSESTSDLIGQISASANPDADIINIAATDPSPKRAADLANAFADQFVAFERAQAQDQAAAGAARLRSEIASLPPAIPPSSLSSSRHCATCLRSRPLRPAMQRWSTPRRPRRALHRRTSRRPACSARSQDWPSAWPRSS